MICYQPVHKLVTVPPLETVFLSPSAMDPLKTLIFSHEGGGLVLEGDVSVANCGKT